MQHLRDILEVIPSSSEGNLRSRRMEEVDYWRKRAGWYDDDVAMTEYNQGVSDTYYEIDDAVSKSGGDGGGMSAFQGKSVGPLVKGGAVVIALLLAVVLYRMLMKKAGSSKSRSKSSSGGKSSRSRSKSASRSRSSRSRSRSRRTSSTTGKKYDLMDDAKSESKSHKSGRSRSRSRKGRSRSKSKSRVMPVTKEVLV